MPLRVGRFAINPQGNEEGFPGYTTGRTWNGWACPLFTREQMEEVIAGLSEMNIRYDADRDCYIYARPKEDGMPAWYAEPEEYPARGIDGLKLYEIGDGWVWEEIEVRDRSQPRTISEEIARLSSSEAGRALATRGFTAEHQGGGLVNFSRPDAYGDREHIVTGLSLDGWGPEALAEPVILVTSDAEETRYSSLSEFLSSPEAQPTR